MKANLNIGKVSRASVWIGEIPELPTSDIPAVDSIGLSAGQILSQRTCAAVEVCVITGPRPQNGLIGGTFEPNESGFFRYQIRPNPPDDSVLIWSLSSNIDTFVAGLPEEYVDSIVKGIEGAAPQERLGSGLLVVDQFAHGRVGSSQMTFERLGAALVDIMVSVDTSVEQLSKLMIERFIITRKI